MNHRGLAGSGPAGTEATSGKLGTLVMGGQGCHPSLAGGWLLQRAVLALSLRGSHRLPPSPTEPGLQLYSGAKIRPHPRPRWGRGGVCLWGRPGILRVFTEPRRTIKNRSWKKEEVRGQERPLPVSGWEVRNWGPGGWGSRGRGRGETSSHCWAK